MDDASRDTVLRLAMQFKSDRDAFLEAAREQGTVSTLLAALDSTDGPARGLALTLLGAIGDSRAVEPLIQILDQGGLLPQPPPIHGMRDRLALRLSRYLRELLADNSRLERQLSLTHAANALGKIGDSRAIGPLRNLLNHQEESVRSAAQLALERLGAT